MMGTMAQQIKFTLLNYLKLQVALATTWRDIPQAPKEQSSEIRSYMRA
jgi:hypothetical protein